MIRRKESDARLHHQDRNDSRQRVQHRGSQQEDQQSASSSTGSHHGEFDAILPVRRTRGAAGLNEHAGGQPPQPPHGVRQRAPGFVSIASGAHSPGDSDSDLARVANAFAPLPLMAPSSELQKNNKTLDSSSSSSIVLEESAINLAALNSPTLTAVTRISKLNVDPSSPQARPMLPMSPPLGAILATGGFPELDVSTTLRTSTASPTFGTSALTSGAFAPAMTTKTNSGSAAAAALATMSKLSSSPLASEANLTTLGPSSNASSVSGAMKSLSSKPKAESVFRPSVLPVSSFPTDPNTAITSSFGFTDSPLLTAFTVSNAPSTSMDIADRFDLVSSVATGAASTLGPKATLSLNKKNQRTSSNSAQCIVLVSLCDQCAEPYPVDRLQYHLAPTEGAISRTITSSSTAPPQLDASPTTSIATSPLPPDGASVGQDEMEIQPTFGESTAAKSASSVMHIPATPQTPQPPKQSHPVQAHDTSRLASPGSVSETPGDFSKGKLHVLCEECLEKVPSSERTKPWTRLATSIPAQQHLASLGRLFQATSAVSSQANFHADDSSFTNPVGPGAHNDMDMTLFPSSMRLMLQSSGRTTSNKQQLLNSHAVPLVVDDKVVQDVSNINAPQSISAPSRPVIVPVSTPFVGPTAWFPAGLPPESSLGPSQHQLGHNATTSERSNVESARNSSRRKSVKGASDMQMTPTKSSSSGTGMIRFNDPAEVLKSMSPAEALAAALVFMKSDLDALMAQRKPGPSGNGNSKSSTNHIQHK